MNYRLTTIIFTIGLLATGTTTFAQSREQRQIMATLQILQEQTQQLAITLAALQQSLDQSVKQLNTRIDETNNAMRKGLADQKITIDGIANDLNRVRTTSDDTNVRLGSLKEELEAVRQTVLALPQFGAPAAPADPNAAAQTAGSPAALPAPPASSTAGLSPNRMFEEARLDYFNGNYDVAITGFQQFLKSWPTSLLADDAQFHIGDSYFLQNRWADAIAAYNEVITDYPTTNSVPDALYKRGLAQERLGQTAEARASWEAAFKKYPTEPGGILAKQNYDRLAARRP